MKQIKEPEEVWAEEALKLWSEHPSRTCQRESIQAAGYDIHELARWYEDYFDKLNACH